MISLQEVLLWQSNSVTCMWALWNLYGSAWEAEKKQIQRALQQFPKYLTPDIQTSSWQKHPGWLHVDQKMPFGYLRNNSHRKVLVPLHYFYLYCFEYGKSWHWKKNPLKSKILFLYFSRLKLSISVISVKFNQLNHRFFLVQLLAVQIRKEILHS